MNKIFIATLFILLSCIIKADEITPKLLGTWRLIRIIDDSNDVNNKDIGKTLSFDQKGHCRSVAGCFPHESEYKLSNRYSYATGNKAWLITFSNTLASDYVVHFSADTLYMLCNCSAGRHFVLVPVKK